MKDTLKALDAKSITMIITSAGGIVISLVLIYLYFSRPTSASGEVILQKVTGFQQEFSAYKSEDISAKKDYTNALIQVSKALEGNTKVMEQVLRSK